MDGLYTCAEICIQNDTYSMEVVIPDQTLVVIAPLPSPPFYCKDLIESIPLMLKRRRAIARLCSFLIPPGLVTIDHSILGETVAVAGIRRNFFTQVCVVGEMTTPDTRRLLGMCREADLRLIDWTPEYSLMRRYLTMLYGRARCGCTA